MGIASLILGIISVVLAFVPVICVFSIVTSIVGLILGIISLVRKNEKVLSIIGVILCVITLILIITTFKNTFDIFNNNTSTVKTTNIETGKQQTTTTTTNDELKKNITVEALGIAKNGDFVFKIKNNNNQAVHLSSINVIFKDANGNFMEKGQSQTQDFGIAANSEVVNYVWSVNQDFSQYPNYEFEIELARDYGYDNMILDNFEITANNTGKQISLQINNNNNVDLQIIKVVVAYYQNGTIVGCQNGYANTTTSANGTAYINISYPQDSHYEDVAFDDYKVYILQAYKN